MRFEPTQPPVVDIRHDADEETSTIEMWMQLGTDSHAIVEWTVVHYEPNSRAQLEEAYTAMLASGCLVRTIEQRPSKPTIVASFLCVDLAGIHGNRRLDPAIEVGFHRNGDLKVFHSEVGDNDTGAPTYTYIAQSSLVSRIAT